MANSSRGGGPAMAGGQRFQAQVTAWWSARVLLQTPVGKFFDLSANSIPERIYCETMDEVDDIRIELTGNIRIFGQCRRSSSLSTKVNSKWAEVLKQFYNELENSSEEKPQRFVLFYEKPNSSLDKLSLILKRYRRLPNGASLIDAATNKKERDIVTNLNNLLNALQEESELTNLATKRKKLLRLSYIKQLQLGVGGADYLEIMEALRNNLLANPAQINQVLTSLHRLADDLIPERGSVDRLALRKHLQDEGILLRDSINYRPDFEKLENFSSTEISTHEAKGRNKLTIAGDDICIPRTVVKEMFEASQKTSFLVVGSAGAGKTGCMLSLAQKLQGTDNRVWYWSADSLPHYSVSEIGTHLKLQHSWKELFEEAASGTGAVLIIDGLDGLRDTRAQKAYRKLISLAIDSGIRVIASIRIFDLRYAHDLQEIFPSGRTSICPRFSEDEFKKANHFVIPELDDEELEQVFVKFPIVQTILETAPQLKSVIRNLFSLDLLCKLIDDGEPINKFSTISTQAELFERHWSKRVDSHRLGHEMTKALRQLVEKMVEQQTLQVVPGDWSGEVNTVLFSAELIRNPSPVPGRLPEEDLVEFSHHLLFDYAAELLFIRPRRRNLATELASSDTWALFLRPSLVLFHRYAWNHGRDEFWEILLNLEQSSVPVLYKLPGYLVVAEEIKTSEDFQPLLEGSIRDNSDNLHWIHMVQGIVSAAKFSSLPKLFTLSSGDWWCEFALNLINTGNSKLVYAGRRILFSAFESCNNLSENGKLLLNQASAALIEYHWNSDIEPNSDIRPPIAWMCSTIASNLSSSSAIIRKMISENELERAGYIQAPKLAEYIENIWKTDPNLAVKVYDAIFGYEETNQSPTPMGNSQILPFISNRRQDYESAYYLLSKKFPKFLSEHPREATRVVIRVIKHYVNQREQLSEPSTMKTFTWNGRECNFQYDYSDWWDGNDQPHDEPVEILHAWADYLKALPAEERANEKWNEISDIIASENDMASVWRRMLIAGSHSPEFYAERLWSIFLNPVILVKSDTKYIAKECIRAFVHCIPNDKPIHRLESVILNLTWNDISDRNTEAVQQYLRKTKAQLLTCLPDERHSTAAREFLANCESELLQTPEENDIATDFRRDSSVTEIQLVRDGVDIERSEHNELLRISEFLENRSADDINDQNLSDILQDIRRVEEKLAELQDEVDTQVITTVQNRIIRGFSQVACSEATIEEDLRNKLFERFRDILTSPSDIPSQQDLEKFDNSQGYSPLNPQVNATKGFICLALKLNEISGEYKEILFQISCHPLPLVRYHLGEKIWAFLKKWPDFVWKTLESWITDLPTQAGTLGVLKGTLWGNWFWLLYNRNKQRTKQLLRNLLSGLKLYDSVAKERRKDCGFWLAALSILKNETWATEILQEEIESILNSVYELEGALEVTISKLLPKAQNTTITPEQRQRALEFILPLLDISNIVLEAYRNRINNLPSSEQPNEPLPVIKEIVHFYSYIAHEFLYAAKVVVDSDAERETWWETVEPIMDKLLVMNHPKIVYDLIKGLEHFVDKDLDKCLHWIRKATKDGESGGLTSETQAADLTIKILEQVLAEHKASLATGSELRSDFVQILEAYLQVGWPKAIRLAVQLESIFR